MLATVIKETLELKTLLEKSKQKPRTEEEATVLLRVLMRIKYLESLYPRAYELLCGEKGVQMKAFQEHHLNGKVGPIFFLLNDKALRSYFAKKCTISAKRLDVYKKSTRCAICGAEAVFLKGKHMPGENGGKPRGFINLFTVKYGWLILMNIDHIHPKSLGGRNTNDNLQLTCHDCNVRKGNKLPTK